jgi:CRP/FNR family transcriptional regulator
VVATWRDDLFEILSRRVVWRALDDAGRRTLCDGAHLPGRPLRRGEVVWAFGSRPDELGVVLRGTLDLVRGRPGRTRKVFRVLERGDALGFSIVAGEPHTVEVLAGRDLELALIPGRVVRGLMSDRPEFALGMIAELGNLVGTLTDELAALRSQDLRARLAWWIRRRGGVGSSILATHQEIAQAVGASRARVSEMLGVFRDEGAVRLGRGRIDVLHVP